MTEGRDRASEGRDRLQRQVERDVEPGRPLHPDANDPRTGDPHDSLSKPATDPDETEFPDPYERRPDPRGPEGVDTPAFPAEEASAAKRQTPAPPSTSEPHPPRNYDEVKPEKGDKGDPVPDA